MAREFRAADIQNEDYPTVQALRYMGRLVTENGGCGHQLGAFQRDSATAQLIQRIGKVE